MTAAGAQAIAELARAPPCTPRVVQALANAAAKVGERRSWAQLQAWIPDLSAELTAEDHERVAFLQRAAASKIPHAAKFKILKKQDADALLGFIDGVCAAARMRDHFAGESLPKQASTRVSDRCIAVADPMRRAFELLAAQASLMAPKRKFARDVVFTAAAVARSGDDVRRALEKFDASNVVLLVAGGDSVEVREAMFNAAHDCQRVWAVCSVASFKD